MTNYYVYYRADPSRLDLLRAVVRELFKAVERETRVRGRWMRRRDEPTTYMEVYEDVKEVAVFEGVLNGQCERLELSRLLGAGAVRRQEIFIDAESVE